MPGSQLVVGPATSVLVAGAAAVTTLTIYQQFRRAWGDQYSLGPTVYTWVNVDKVVTFSIQFIDENGNIWPSGFVDYINPGIVYQAPLVAIGYQMQAVFTNTLANTTISYNFSIR